MNELSSWRRRLARNGEIEAEFSRVPEPEEIPLSHYWNILVKRRRVILPIFFVVVAAGSYFALSATSLYTAAATIKIEPQNPRVTGVGELQPLDLRGEYDYHQTQFALLQSRPLAARVITELGLESNKTFTHANIVSANPVDHLKSWVLRPLSLLSSYVSRFIKSTQQRGQSNLLQHATAADKLVPELSVSSRHISRYLGFIEVEPIRKTRLVSVQFTTPDPALSQVLANAHVQMFMRMNLESRFSLTQEAREFLDTKKNELQQKLEKSELDLNKFRRAHGVLSVEKGENIVVDRLIDLNKQLTVARAQRIEAESLYRTVENRNYQDLAEIMRQGLVQQLKSNLANLEADKARSSTIFKPDHPRIQELNQQIAAARQAFNNEIANVVRGIRSNYAAAVAKERALESEAEKQQRDALKLKELGVQYLVLHEEVNANRSLYESVLKRLSETNFSNDLAVSNMQIVSKAATPLGPSGPNAPMYLLASIISGLFLGISAAFLREVFDSAVGTPDEVWRSVGLGTLGVVPHLKFLDRPTYSSRPVKKGGQVALPSANRVPGMELITNHAPLSILNEAYRTIRTSLLLSQAERPPQVILLTSPSPGEGKTLTTLNLAIALARDGHTVLLVDADMRKGCCHDRLGLTNNRGLSNVLTGSLSLDQGIQETSVRGLSLLSRGVLPPNPSELLGSRKMRELLQELRQRFEFILIDSPPVIAISDAAIVSVMSDGVLLVFDGHKTSTASAQRAVERLDALRARFIGVILNAVNLEDPDYSYYRSYSNYYHQQKDNEGVIEESAKEWDAGATSSDVAGEHKSGEAPASREIGAKDRVNGKSPKLNSEDVRSSPLVDEDLGDQKRKAGLDPGHGPRSAKPTKEHLYTRTDGTVSPVFLEQIIGIFIAAVGTIGPLIVREHISFLGESEDAFPKSRLDELVKSIEREIQHPEMRLWFQKQLAAELRNLENY